jgi:HTH-type transcriptional regulator/antitoxin HigA
LTNRLEALRVEEQEYLDVLSDLVEQYEQEHLPVADVSAADILRFLIEQRGVTQQSVARETGIANSTISAVLKGGRELTRRHIESLAAYFGVEPAVFLPGNG